MLTSNIATQTSNISSRKDLISPYANAYCYCYADTDSDAEKYTGSKAAPPLRTFVRRRASS